MIEDGLSAIKGFAKVINLEEIFSERVNGNHSAWIEGQSKNNVASLQPILEVRRDRKVKRGEAFELADLKTDYRGKTIIVEYDVKQLPLTNLIKYWPYITNELDKTPINDVFICQFSDWWSYASYRDLWEWSMEKMRVEPKRIVNVDGRQFDHGGENKVIQAKSIKQAVDWFIARIG